MKRVLILFIYVLVCCQLIKAQQRVVDAEDSIPVSAASIFDASGSVIGYTLADGTFSDISNAEYPITLRSLGYEPLTIELAKDTVWKMKPSYIDMQELVVVPVERNVMKQTFYMRAYFSISNATDTVTYFAERMAYRFVPATKGVKTGVSSQMHTTNSCGYSHYKNAETDSVALDNDSKFPLMLSVVDISSAEVSAPESFKTTSDSTLVFEEKGKSGSTMVAKQSGQIFTHTGDMLADTKDHTFSPWALKLLGMTMDINQLYSTNVYRVNNEGHYTNKDLLQSCLVMEADCRGKLIRKALDSDTPVLMRTMVEMYVVDREFFSMEEAIAESKKKTEKMKFVIPADAPPLNEATLLLIERAKASK